MDTNQLIAIAAIIVLAIVLGTLRRTLTNFFGAKMITATQGDKPKSRLQKFFGW